jgi:hypothetical protein
VYFSLKSARYKLYAKLIYISVSFFSNRTALAIGSNSTSSRLLTKHVSLFDVCISFLLLLVFQFLLTQLYIDMHLSRKVQVYLDKNKSTNLGWSEYFLYNYKPYVCIYLIFTQLYIDMHLSRNILVSYRCI